MFTADKTKRTSLLRRGASYGGKTVYSAGPPAWQTRQNVFLRKFDLPISVNWRPYICPNNICSNGMFLQIIQKWGAVR